MKRSRVALLLFMATFACSLLAAGMAGGEGGVAAQQFTGGTACGGYCEFAYDPVDEEPYDACGLDNCEFAGCDRASPLAKPQTLPWFDDDSLNYDDDYFDADRVYSPSRFSASVDESTYGLPAEDELPLDPASGDEVGPPSLESESSASVPNSSGDHWIYDPLTRTPCQVGPCTRYSWPELFGDTDGESEMYEVHAVAVNENLVSQLIADVGLSLDELLGRHQAASPADFVRQIEAPSMVASSSSGSAVGGGWDAPGTPELEVIAVWGGQLRDWLAQQNWLARELATINARAQFYLEGLTPPPATRITLEWSKVDPAGRAQRFLSNLWKGYRQAAWGLSQGASQISSIPGLFSEPVRQAQDPSVRTRTSLRTPWRLDL